MSLASRHPLRKSCSFCRARKIKCSNGTICEACKKQNVDCVYDWDSRPTKARTLSQESPRSDNGLPGFSSPQRQRSSTAGSPSSTPPGVILEEPNHLDSASGLAPPENPETVASLLVQMWNDNFTEAGHAGIKQNPWRERIATFHQTVQANLQDRSEHVVQTKFTLRNVKYTGILSLLTQDLVGLVVDKFGGLGSLFMDQGGGRFFLTGLANDTTQTMFDPSRPGPSPLAELGQRQITQMIDVWYSVHPLSFLVSKTLLLRELRDGTHDDVLLAVILADASFSIGDDVSVARGHVMIRWAAAQLQSRSFPTRAGQPNPAGAAPLAISTAQALMLMGWNALCQYHVRRATCYIGLASKLATELKDLYSSGAVPMATSRINGIDVFEVEKEVVAYLYWTTYTCTLWTFMQIGNNFSALLPTSLTSIFLPVDETSSVLMRLDEVSDNFSTLQRQKAVIKEMWPLAHIASITAYIYALYPQESDPNEPVSTNFWQEAPLLALQRIQQGSSPQDMACVCREVYRVLMESIHLLNRQVPHQPSRSLVLAVYHTVAIHLLFPAVIPGAPPPMEPVNVNAETIERFIMSASELVGIFDAACEPGQEPLIVTSQARNAFPDIYSLALDSCARAMSFIHAQKKAGAILMEPQFLQIYEDKLSQLAHRLHGMAKSEFLNSGSSIRVVKKHLKAVVRAFAGHPGGHSQTASLSSSASSGASPRHGSLSPSRTPAIGGGGGGRDTDSLSTATTTVVEPPSYISPSEALRPSSGCKPANTIASSDIPTSYPAFSPIMARRDGADGGKTDWRAADELFQHVMDHSALGSAPTSGAEHMTLADLVDAQASWMQGSQMLMDFDMAASQVPAPWDWPHTEMHHDTPMATAGGEPDMMHYFKK
ncbi:hypothetical protein ACRALDRAFT_1080026 [Sodiomyces alcalophilus JCM 7366]|uniref:uncharacterized protein n=1 Tax=Sodiomyces alcalophilus JCM 7366 TaxID=591952 RepID=UPI0039B43907